MKILQYSFLTVFLCYFLISFINKQTIDVWSLLVLEHVSRKIDFEKSFSPMGPPNFDGENYKQWDVRMETYFDDLYL